MSDDQQSAEQQQSPVNEDGPGVNGDLASWLYVVGGIPMMIIFFVVLFALVGACDGQNILFSA